LPKITDIEAEAFDEVIKGSDIPVVLEFWIRSCGFCQKFKPVYMSSFPTCMVDGSSSSG